MCTRFRAFAPLIAALVLTGCGGGGSALPTLAVAGRANSSALSSIAALTPAAGLSVLQANTLYTSDAASSIQGGLRSAPTPGNLLIAAFFLNDGSEATLSTPAGWKYVGRATEGNIYLGIALYWHVVAAGEANNYSFAAGGPGMPRPLGLSLSEVAGANTTSPIDRVGYQSAGVGYGETTAPLTPTVTGTQGLAYFAQYVGGNFGTGYNSGSGWSYGAGVSNAGGGAMAFESQVRNGLTTDTSTAIAAHEPWSGGENSAQASAIVLIAPASASAGTAPQTGPAHVLTWLYYGLNGINTSVPAAFMASKATFVETDSIEGTVAQNFKNAGGKYAVNYTDPTLVPGCNAPFTAPAGTCTGEIGNLGLVESAYLHAPDGSRLNKAAYGAYQEILNPGSAAAQAGFTALAQQKLSQVPGLDFFFADDSGGPFDGVDGTPASGLLWNFNQQHSAEYGDGADQEWISARAQMLAAAPRPVFINGRDYATWLPSYNGAYLESANVVGENNEGCFNADDYGVMNDTSNHWQNMANSLLAVTALRKYAVCMMMGQVTPASRLYAYASWWMTYDPVFSIGGQVNTGPDGYAVYPEFDIVPTLPKTTAASNISGLRSGGSGPYVREFGACYQDGAAIGPCAAIVNTSGSTQAVPPLTGTYAHTLSLDSNGTYTGGRAWWANGVPASIGTTSAVIVAR